MPGRPVYATRLVVRADSDIRVAGGHLWRPARLYGRGLPFRLQRVAASSAAVLAGSAARKLYRESIGPLTTPRRVIEALLAGDIDVGPLDSYALDLMLRHDPDLARRSGSSRRPIPRRFRFWSRAADVPRRSWRRCRRRWRNLASAAACADLRERLCLQAFAPVAIADYESDAALGRRSARGGICAARLIAGYRVRATAPDSSRSPSARSETAIARSRQHSRIAVIERRAVLPEVSVVAAVERQHHGDVVVAEIAGRRLRDAQQPMAEAAASRHHIEIDDLARDQPRRGRRVAGES